MIKQLIILIILLLSVGLISAGEIVRGNDGTIYIYNDIEQSVRMRNNDNFNRTICINATVIEGEISIKNTDNYEFEYTFIADLNDSTYINRIVIMKQVVKSNSLLNGKVLNRTLSLDGVIIGNYETKTNWLGHGKSDIFYFDLIDNNLRYGDDIIINESLAFTQLNYEDQYNYLDSTNKIYQPVIAHKYISVSYTNESFKSGLELRGLTGIMYNVFGDSVLTQLPIVGGAIAGFGKSIQSLLFLPLTIIQLCFNLIFSFLNVLINNWWYSILLLEILCIIPACKHNNYVDIVSTYISMHIKIFNFMYQSVVLPTIRLILRLIEIIRDMFRI